MKGANLLIKGFLLVIVLSLFGVEEGICRDAGKKMFAGDSSVYIDFGSEPRFNLSVHGGYALALGSNFKFYPDDISSIDVNIVERNVPVKTTKYSSPSKGLGEGFRAGVGLSYIINDFMNVGIDIDYFRSTIRKTRDSFFHQVQTINNVAVDYKFSSYGNISYSATMISFTPNITFKAITGRNFLIYNKVGAVVIFRPKSIEKENQYNVTHTVSGIIIRDSAGTARKEYAWKVRNPALGLSTSLGYQFNISNRVRAFAELQFSHVVFEAKRRSLTLYTANGENLLNSLPVNQKEILFLKNFTATNGPADPNLPAETLSQTIPITYVGLQAGITYRF